MEAQVNNLLIDETRAELNTHVAVCELRYESICARLKRLEVILIGAAGFIIAALINLATKLQ